MIIPIVAYGDPVLRKHTRPVDLKDPQLSALIQDMFDTMYAAPGVGLAAPQIGKSLRLFVVDSAQLKKSDDQEEDSRDKLLAPGDSGIIEAFVNPTIIEESGELCSYEEGCLSIPGIREMVKRKSRIRIQFLDRNLQAQDRVFEGFTARIIQHEYDHIEGVLFTDYVAPLRKSLLKSRLDSISKGQVPVSYKMKYPNVKKART